MIKKIYLLDINIFNNKEIYDYWYKLMSDDRKKKIDKYIQKQDKRLSLGAGVLLYKCLKEYGIKDNELVYSTYGKPYVIDNRIYFNISHAHNYVVCAFSDKEVGIDIEEKRIFKQNIIHRIFNEKEINDIEQSKEDKLQLYTELWTMKESLLKYLGTGIIMNPKKIMIDVRKKGCINCPGLNDKVYFSNFVIDDYSLTLCSEYVYFSTDITKINLTM